MAKGSKIPDGYPSGARVGAKVALQNVLLTEAQLNVAVPPPADAVAVEALSDLRTSWELYTQGLRVLVGVWVRIVPAERTDDQGVDPMLSVIAEHTLEYVLPDDFEPTDEEIHGFVEQSAVLTAWPYARETIQTLAARAGMPQLVLPIHKVSLPAPTNEGPEATEQDPPE